MTVAVMVVLAAAEVTSWLVTCGASAEEAMTGPDKSLLAVCRKAMLEFREARVEPSVASAVAAVLAAAALLLEMVVVNVTLAARLLADDITEQPGAKPPAAVKIPSVEP